jgi:hypothetical protein
LSSVINMDVFGSRIASSVRDVSVRYNGTPHLVQKPLNVSFRTRN